MLNTNYSLDKLSEMMQALQTAKLEKGLEAGYRVGSPGSWTQGAALQVEDLSPTMYTATYQQKNLYLMKELPERKAKSLTVEYDRQLSYGLLGSSATLEVSAGQDNTLDVVRDFMPVKFYTTNSRTSLALTKTESFDGMDNEARQADSCAKKISGDLEFDIFRGQADFSNGGVFDGNPNAIPNTMPNMKGLDVQIRQSDFNLQTQDLMMAEYGAGDSNVVFVGGVLSQSFIEDLNKRSKNNYGEAVDLYIGIDEKVAFNKATQSKERIVLAGSPQRAQGASIDNNWVTEGNVAIHSSVFLRGKKGPPLKTGQFAPANPTIALAQAASTTTFKAAEVYSYYVTAQNETGESLVGSAVSNITIAANGNLVNVTITPAAGNPAKWFNVYRSVGTVGATSKANIKFIGRVANSGAATTVFVDLNNKVPGSSTGFFLDKVGIDRHSLASFESVTAATVDTSLRKIYYSMTCVAAKLPRTSVLADCLLG